MEKQKIEFCQCCLQRSSNIHLRTPNIQFGKPNTYEEMLKQCYDIDIVNNDKAQGICILCVKRLRDAFEFRLQVIMCQNNLRQKIATSCKEDKQLNRIKNESNTDEVKIGVPNLSIKQESVYEIPIGDCEQMINCEDLQSNSTLIPCKRIKKEIESKNRRIVSCKKSAVSDSCMDRKVRSNQKKSKSIDAKEGCLTADQNLLEANDDDKSKQKINKKKIINNIMNIIEKTNCTPFNNVEITGIACAYCKSVLKNLHDLKSHIKTEHITEKLYITKDFSALSIKVDITDLRCAICDATAENVATVARHLREAHAVTFYENVAHYIQEFKLPTDGVFQCVLCHSKYETFKMILQHMNCHYRNFICEICDAGFLNMGRYNKHRLLHNTERFGCTVCDKTFKSAQGRNDHERVHRGEKPKFWPCPHCGLELSANYYTRNKHLLAEHNISAAKYECSICNLSFLVKSRLTRHIKKDHLLEKNNKCTECDYRCYGKRQLRMHMIKHTGERRYKCDICLKAYSTKHVLSEHMRIHANDRRHKCRMCNSAFVQKCSLKSHLLSHHSMSIEDNDRLLQDE